MALKSIIYFRFSANTIKLLAYNFYALVVDSGFALIKYHRIELLIRVASIPVTKQDGITRQCY